jgi:hypothetical protein
MTTGTHATATAIVAGSAWPTPRITATLNRTSPVAAMAANHSQSAARGQTIFTPAIWAVSASSAAAAE